MKTNAAQKKYLKKIGVGSFAELTVGQKAYFTRICNTTTTQTAKTNTTTTTQKQNTATFRWSGSPRKIVVEITANMTVMDGLRKGNVEIDVKKEGVVYKSTNGKDDGEVAKFIELLISGATYIITPGIDSGF